MNGNEEAENSRYQNLEEIFVFSPLPCMNALSVYQWRGEENDKSRWMPLKLKRIKYLINSVIFEMFPWDVCCVCRGEVQSEFVERRNSEWNARCQRKADQDVIKEQHHNNQNTRICINFAVVPGAAVPKEARRQSTACHRPSLWFSFLTT